MPSLSAEDLHTLSSSHAGLHRITGSRYKTTLFERNSLSGRPEHSRSGAAEERMWPVLGF